MKDDRVQIQIKENHDGEHRSLVLDGILTLPPEQEEEENNLKRRGIVVFAHGSGSSGRHSPRNRYVASVLNNSGIDTLLVDLLTPEEQEIDEKTKEYRFNITLLANRLAEITWWLVLKNPRTQNVSSIGYFGSSTGAAASLIASVERPNIVRAIVY